MAKDEHRDGPDFEDSGESSHAADEPTAVWDMEALRKAGLSELANLPEQPAPGPATPADGMAQRPSIIVEGEGARPAARPEDGSKRAAPATPQRSAAGWAGLFALAVLLGGVAYLAMRFLR